MPYGKNVNSYMTRSSWLSLLLVLGLGWSTAVLAIDPVEFTDADLANRYKNLVTELRCLVCQNQAIADSDAPLAKDMRDVVVTMLHDGATDAQIIAFMTERYGEFVLLRPTFSAGNLALWGLPFVILVGGLLLLPKLLNRQPVHLSEQEREQAQQLLDK